MPVDEPIVATEMSLMLHTPPPVASLNVVDVPGHISGVPVIEAGKEFTVTGIKLAHPDEVRVNVMFTVPADTPVTTPVDAPTVATVVLLLLHVPLPDASVRVIVEPWQTDGLPAGVAGPALTVTGCVTDCPQNDVYDIVAVPTFTPDTTPVKEPTVATEVLLLLQVPPATLLVNVVVPPTHVVAVPPIVAGGGHHVKVSPFEGLTIVFCVQYDVLVPAVVDDQLLVVVLVL